MVVAAPHFPALVPETLQTARLRGVRPTSADRSLFLELGQDPRVMATLGGTVSDEELGKRFQWNLGCWSTDGFGQWLWFDSDSGAFVGRGGLRRMEVLGRPQVEVGYALMPAHMGRGLATEIALASVAAGFESAGLDEIVAFTMTTNTASRRVIGKTGFTYECDFVRAGLPHVFFRLRRRDWLSADLSNSNELAMGLSRMALT